MTVEPKISVIGLGYVGLPLAVALSEHFDVVGYDRSEARIAELNEGRDATRSVDIDVLRRSFTLLTNDPGVMIGSDLFIIAVPTPVD